MEGPLDGVSAFARANATGQVMAAMQIFAIKHASDAQASAALTLLQSLPDPAPVASAPHLGRHVDASA